MGRNGILTAGFLVCLSLLATSVVSADEPITNETLLKEIKALKETVNRQAQKIEDLEQRVKQQEMHSPAPGVPAVTADIDKKIDERLEKRIPGYRILDGLSMWIGATTVLQSAHNANGDSQLSKKEDVTDASYAADITFEKKFEDYGEAYVYLSAGQGSGVDNRLALYQGVNYAAADDVNVTVAEAWYEQYFPAISGALAFGKLDAASYIDTNEYANDSDIQFLGLIFNNSPVVEFPSNGAAVHFGASPLEWLSVNLIAQDGNADWADVFDGTFLAGQLNFKPKFFGKDGNYRLLAWNNGTNHTKWTDTEKDKESGYGYGLSFDQELTKSIGVFARYGWQDPKVYVVDTDDPGSEFSLEQSWSLGPQFKGTLWGRPEDIAGIGFGQIIPSNKYKTFNDFQAKTESHLECYYNFKVNDHLNLSPDLQVIWQPYGKDATKGDGTIVVGGLRGRMDF
ncbi:MAG: carbohydrate porin [Candidatus Omnitrophica bacterium]|nr:carbohydrate porin [Candidatus Omnitrophota bacterium]